MAPRTELMTRAEATISDPEADLTPAGPKTVFDLLQNPATQQQLVMAMNDEAGARRLTRIIMTEIRKTPKLGECTTQSLLGAAMMCAQLDLEPGQLGQAYIIPRWNGKLRVNEAQFQLGYKGMIELAYRTGKVRSVYCDSVCEGDTFHMRVGTNGGFVHEVDYTRARGPAYAYYAYADLIEGGWTAKVLTLQEIYDNHRARSDAWKFAEFGDKAKGGSKKDSPWHTDEHAMCLKTAMRVLFTWLPKSAEVIDAMEADNAVVMADLSAPHHRGLTITREDLMAEPEPPALEEPVVTVHRSAELPEPAPAEEPWDRPAPGAETVIDVAPEAGSITVDDLLALGIDAGKIPAGKPLGQQRRVLLTLAKDATGREWGTLEDAVAQEGPAIATHIRGGAA